MAINTITATEGNWLFNGESFATKVSGFGDLSKWEEVSDDFKTQWEAEHANPDIEGGGEYLTEVPDDGKVYGRTHGEWVEAEKAKGDYKQLIEYTVTENTSQIEFLKTDAGEDITKYRDLIIDCILIYDANNTGRAITLITDKNRMAKSGGICKAEYLTFYRIRIKIGNRFTTKVYFESHTNAWFNPQYTDGNQGVNAFSNIVQDPVYVKLLLQSQFLAGEKLTIYGR